MTCDILYYSDNESISDTEIKTFRVHNITKTMINKTALKEAMLSAEHGKVNLLEEEIEDFISNGNMDNDNVIDIDDESHAEQRRVDYRRLDGQLHEHSEHINTLKAISFEEKDTVGPGAVVELDNRFIVVAVAETKFKFNGRNFIAISTDAPLYQSIKDKKAGDACQFRDRSFTIKSVY